MAIPIAIVFVVVVAERNDLLFVRDHGALLVGAQEELHHATRHSPTVCVTVPTVCRASVKVAWQDADT
jgi:hypothetical protein